MPAAKTLLQLGNGWFPIALAFGADEFEQADILRRRAANWFRRFHRKERGIYAASTLDCMETPGNFERSVFADGEAA
jgi:hypothetical protein